MFEWKQKKEVEELQTAMATMRQENEEALRGLQQERTEMQQQLETLEMTGVAGGGLVQVTLNGKSELKKIKIDKSVLDPEEAEVVEDLIVAAFNDAKQKVSAHAEAEMHKLTGGLNLPAGMKLPF